MNKGVLYWITGLPGAGKTTIGTALYYRLKEQYDNVVLLDGDSLKDVISGNEEVDYSNDGRIKRAKQYARICKMLTDQHMIVICCTISMSEEVREWNRTNNERYAEIYLEVPQKILVERDYRGMYSAYLNGEMNNVVGYDIKADVPQNPDLKIINDGSHSVDDCVDQIVNLIPAKLYEETDDVEYWNGFYSSPISAPQEASAFAKEIMNNYLEKGKRLLELGCGNGRDSIFFDANGISVVALDSSSQAIHNLNKWRNENKRSAFFACDDFTSANVIYRQDFDYCYSRFTLHSITVQQEVGVIRNVSSALRKGGYFFIEVRSVNDEIYGKGEEVGKDAYIYNGHYRRFIRKEEMEKRLKEYGGFDIVYSVEDRSFAQYKDMNPPIIRIVARK